MVLFETYTMSRLPLLTSTKWMLFGEDEKQELSIQTKRDLKVKMLPRQHHRVNHWMSFPSYNNSDKFQSAIRKKMAPRAVFWVDRHNSLQFTVFVWESDGK